MTLRPPLIAMAFAALASAGCMTRSLQLAQPVGKGNTDVSFEAGINTLVEKERRPLGMHVRTFYPAADVVVRHGLSDNLDFSFRTGTTGYEAGLKRTLTLNPGGRVHFAGEARFGMIPSVTMPPVWQATVGAVAQWSPTDHFHLLFAPRVSLFALAASPDMTFEARQEDHSAGRGDLGTQNSNLGYLPVASLGVGYDVHPAARVFVEASAQLHPALFATAREGHPSLSGAVAIQWRPRSTGESAPRR